MSQPALPKAQFDEQHRPLLQSLDYDDDNGADVSTASPYLAPPQPTTRSVRHAALALSVLFLVSIGITAHVFYRFSTDLLSNFHLNTPLPSNAMSGTTQQRSPVSGWVRRAVEHPAKDSFAPDGSKLLFGITRSTPVQPNALVAGYFDPDFLVDGNGHVLKLSDQDAHALTALVRSAFGEDIPKPGGFRNQWRIAHERTSMPIHWLKLVDDDGRVDDVSISGYTPDSRDLSKSVAGLVTLPEKLQETFGVLDEGRTTAAGGGNSQLAEQVAEIIATRE